MRHSLKWFIPAFIFLLLIAIPFNAVNAEETEKELYPSIDKGDESDNVQPGSGQSGSSAVFELPDYGAGLDDILSSEDSEEDRFNREREKTPDDDSDSIDKSDDESEKNGEESTEPENTDEKEENIKKGEEDNDSFIKGLWDNINKTVGPTFGLVNSLDGTGPIEGDIKLGRSFAKVPVSLLKPNMSDGQKAASELGIFGTEATEDTIKWVKRFRDPVSRAQLAQQYPNLTIGLTKSKGMALKIKNSTADKISIGKDAVKTNSTSIYVAAKGKELLGKTKNLFSNGGSILANTFSKGVDFLASKGNNLLSKGKSLLSGPLSKGKELLSKGSGFLSSTFSKGKDLLSKGKNLLSGPISKGKDLLSKGSSIFSNTVSKGKDLLSKGKNLLSGPIAKGKDLLNKGSGLITNAVSKGKEIGKTVLNSNAFSHVKNFATKGTGVLSAVGAVSDAANAVGNFASGNHLDGVGNTLGAVGGTVAAISMFTPVGPIVATGGLIATGASLVIKHRKAIKKGVKKAKDTVVNAAKTAGNKIKDGFKSLGKGIGGLLGG